MQNCIRSIELIPHEVDEEGVKTSPLGMNSYTTVKGPRIGKNR